jgi:hypothetical protein
MEKDFRDFPAGELLPGQRLPAPPGDGVRRHYWRCAACGEVLLSENLVPAPESCNCGNTVFATIWTASFLK